MNTDNFVKKLLGNTILIFVLIVILIIIATYLSFQKIETYKFLVVINVISAIIIFVLLSVNDHYKSKTGYELIEGGNPSQIDDQKIKYFNSIFDNPPSSQSFQVSNQIPLQLGGGLNNNSSLNNNVPLNVPMLRQEIMPTSNTVVDDVDKQIENIIKELQ